MTQAHARAQDGAMPEIETPNPPKMSFLSKDTWVPASLIVTLCGAALSFGIMYQRINGLEAQLSDVRAQVNNVSSIRDEVIGFREQIKQLNTVTQEVRADVKDLKDRR